MMSKFQRRHRAAIVLMAAIFPFLLMAVAQAASPVVINEVLANEPGSAVVLEWVELHNRTDSSITLANFVFVDGNDTTALAEMTLSPGGYGILARRLTAGPGENSFESTWGDGSGIWGDDATEQYPALAATMSLRNTADTVALYHGHESSRLFWSNSADDGISLERILPESPDESESFVYSADPDGSTPGRINSATPRPNDLAFDTTGITITPYPPREYEPLTFSFTVVNIGLDISTANYVRIADDFNFDCLLTENEILDSLGIPALQPGQAYPVSSEGSFAGGFHQVVVEIGQDDDTTDNHFVRQFKVAYGQPEIVINEYLPDPLPGKSEEWIELYNRSETPVDLAGWQIGDSVAQSFITEDVLVLPPGEFLVVCEQLDAFTLVYPETAPARVVEVNGWRTLNNTGDRIVLVDDFGYVVDSLRYAEMYGGERSIERIDPDGPSGNPANWWGSVDPAGATPGAENSTAVDYTDDLQVSISPNPFVRGSMVEIHYGVPLLTMMSAAIYDLNGRMVKSLLEDEPVVSGMLVWEGADGHGLALPPGIYVAFFETEAGARRKIPIAVRPE